jgi:hypothetical protein
LHRFDNDFKSKGRKDERAGIRIGRAESGRSLALIAGTTGPSWAAGGTYFLFLVGDRTHDVRQLLYEEDLLELEGPLVAGEGRLVGEGPGGRGDDLLVIVKTRDHVIAGLPALELFDRRPLVIRETLLALLALQALHFSGDELRRQLVESGPGVIRDRLGQLQHSAQLCFQLDSEISEGRPARPGL